MTLPTNIVLEDAELEDYLQAWVVSLTGLDGSLVRPRWQAEPPDLPEFGTSWCAFGITNQQTPAFAAELQTTDTTTEIRRHEELSCLASFYGPEAGRYASLFRDNLQLPINREYLTLQGMGVIQCDNIVNAPELVKERWLRRKDVGLTLRRQIVRDYSTSSLLSAQGTLNNEEYITSIHIS